MIKVLAPCLLLWIFSVWGEVYFFSLVEWFKPNLFFLVPMVFTLRWRGAETYFIFLAFGLTADCFSSLPFGLFGLSFFIMGLLIRWYAIKIFQEYLLTVPVICGFFTLVCSMMVFLLENFAFQELTITFSWVRSLILTEVIPTGILAIPVFQALVVMDLKLKNHLAERKF